MPAFYEFHDSLLQSIDQDGDTISIHLRAVRTELEPGGGPPSLYQRQEIRLVLHGAEMTVDSPSLPSWLLEGSLRAQSLDADPADTTAGRNIPVSLRTARDVELVLAGLHEGSGDFVTIRLRAQSLTLDALAKPETLQHTRASI